MPNSFDQEKDRLRQALDELTALNQIAAAINALMSVEQITQVIVDHCVRKIHASQGAVFLLEEKIQQVEPGDIFKTFIREFSISAERTPVHLNASISGWMIKNRTILISNNPDTDERFRGFKFSPLGIHSILAAPLLARTRLIGTLAVFNKKDGEGFSENDMRFLGIVGSQTAKVIENARLHEQEEKLTAIREEIRLASSIQQGFLPKTGVSLPGCEICGFNSPASEVGGDFYDIVRIDDHRIFVSLGDVAGKGIPAALLMSNAQAVLRSNLVRDGEIDLGKIADSLNNLICQFSSPEQYITAVFGIFDLSQNLFRFINGGHLAPILIKQDGALERFPQADLIIGIIPGIEFHVNEVRIEKSESLFLYSDGITELYSEDDKQFGDEMLSLFLAQNRDKDIPTLCTGLFENLTKYRGRRDQSDDITMVAIRVFEH